MKGVGNCFLEYEVVYSFKIIVTVEYYLR